VLNMNDVPQKYVNIASGLPYRSYITVGVLLSKLNLINKTNIKTIGNIVPDNWIYVNEKKLRMSRFQIYNNWSPYLVKDVENTVWIGLEYYCNENDELWNMSDMNFLQMGIEEMKKINLITNKGDVLDFHIERVPKAYPAYFGTYYQIDELKQYLDGIQNLFCIGRNGQHRYNNMDHSMCTSFETVKNILNKETNKTNIWNVNTERKYQE